MRIFAIKTKKLRIEKKECMDKIVWSMARIDVTVIDFKYGDGAAIRLIYVKFSLNFRDGVVYL